MRTAAYVKKTNLTAKTDEWLKKIRSRVAPRPNLTLSLDRSALLVVDMLRYFAHPDGRCYLPAADAVIQRIRDLILAWRDSKRPIIFTRHCHESAGDLGMLGKFFSDFISAGEPDSKIIAELNPLPDEPVLRKTTYDAFLGTELKSILLEKKVEQVLIAGVLTHMCCETTARSAFCRGFEVYIPVDAVASSNEELHLGSLFSMADAIAMMTSTKEILK